MSICSLVWPMRNKEATFVHVKWLTKSSFHVLLSSEIPVQKSLDSHGSAPHEKVTSLGFRMY